MHIVFLNPQGNFDQHDSLWTMHPDFGGQLVYVKEIAVEMSKLGHKVDILTRFIDDPKFPEFNGEFDGYQDVDNLRIIRIKCGGTQFLNKELLWEHLDEWTDNIITFYKDEGTLFDFATGHYGDGGLACSMIKQKTGIPYSFTGHSLGAQKFEKLNDNFKNFDDLERKYHFSKRILGERTAIENSDLIFVSTTQEKEEQYTHILYKDTNHTTNPLSFIVAPPGANTSVFAPYWSASVKEETVIKIERLIKRDIDSKRTQLPFIVLASRLDPKKNHIGLVKAYSENLELQQRSNLLISLRGVDNAYDDYSMMKPEEIEIIDEIMTIIDTAGLKGHVSFMSINSQFELADTYRFMAKQKSVFALTALYEPFGLAPIEAMSTGLPVGVTMYGGPSDVLEEQGEKFGVLLDVHNTTNIGEGLNQLFENYDYYQKQGSKRVISKYTWQATARTYLKAITDKLSNKKTSNVELPCYFMSKDLKDLDTLFILHKY